MVKIGIIGGSGLDDPKIIKDPKNTEMQTPYGDPSSLIKEGKIDGVAVALMARHGRKHSIPPNI